MTRKGYKQTKEHKRHLKENRPDFSGNKHPMFGKKQTNKSNEKRRKSMKGKNAGTQNGMYNKKHTSKAKEKQRQAHIGKGLEEQNGMWKGDDVKYNGLHSWVVKHLGQPSKCEHCSKDNLSGQQIHWANISGEYKRELNDWIRLCAKCHKKFDT